MRIWISLLLDGVPVRHITWIIRVLHLPVLEDRLAQRLDLQGVDLHFLVSLGLPYGDLLAADEEPSSPVVEGGRCKLGGVYALTDVLDHLNLLQSRVPEADGPVLGNCNDLLLLVEDVELENFTRVRIHLVHDSLGIRIDQDEFAFSAAGGHHSELGRDVEDGDVGMLVLLPAIFA